MTDVITFKVSNKFIIKLLNFGGFQCRKKPVFIYLFFAYPSIIIRIIAQLQIVLVLYGSFQMGDRVGPVGTGEAGHTAVASGPASRCPVNWSMSLDRKEALVSLCPFPIAEVKMVDDIF